DKRAVAQAIHEAGVRIGEAELAKQDAVGAINDKRLQAELDRLRDPDSGLSRRYFKRAAEGAFDSANVTEARVRTEEKEAIDRKEQAREEKPMKPRKPETAALRKELKAAQAAEYQKRGIKKRPAGDVQYDEIVAKGAESASAPSGPHDLKAEVSMLNAILGAMGIEEKITDVRPLKDGDARGLKGGNYSRRQRAIGINEHLHGAERVEVLAHELGHHLFWNEIAKHVEGGFDALRGMTL